MISDAPLPPDAIGLADAFQRVCVARIPEWLAIQAELEAASEAFREAMAGRSAALTATLPQLHDWAHLSAKAQQLRYKVQERLFDAKTRADRILREALAARDIRALIRNPATGEIAEITNSNEWKIDAAGLDRLETVEYEPGFSVNHVSEWRRPNQDSRRVLLVNPMPEQPGPPSHFGDGVRCPVFLMRDSFEEWLTVEEWDQVVLVADSPKRRWAKEALLAEWPTGKVPSSLSVRMVVDRIKGHYRKITERAGSPDHAPSDATVRRQLGRE